MPECPYCCRFEDEPLLTEHINALHLDGQGQVIPTSVVDKLDIQRIVEVNGITFSIQVGRDLSDSYRPTAHPSLVSYFKLVVYRAPTPLGGPESVPELYVFERTSASSYGDAPVGYELIWVVGEWSLQPNGNTVTPV